MPVRPLPYASIESLLRDHWVPREDARTAALIGRLRAARRRGYLTRGELVEVCRWKSPRTLGLVRSNNHHRIRRATATAILAMDERERLDALVALHGVSIPTASAVLTMLEPERYGVIDIRVWQLLHAMGAVDRRPGGVGFTCEDWLRFLSVLRDLGVRLDAPVRAVERSLFTAHRTYQQGLLYPPSPMARS